MKTRVLIVDDEPIARRGIRRYLAEHDGIEVAGEAANGISAVEQIIELHPDIVFLDVQTVSYTHLTLPTICSV